MAEQVTTLARWTQQPDGSWVPQRLDSVRNPNGGGNPGGGSDFLTPSEVIADDNVVIDYMSDGSIVIRQGGHAIQSSQIPMPFRSFLNFGPGLTVTDDAGNDRINIDVDTGVGIPDAMRWRGQWDVDDLYRTGDVVMDGPYLFIFTGQTQFGYGFGPYGEGAYGGAGEAGGFGFGGYGGGGYGGG